MIDKFRIKPIRIGMWRSHGILAKGGTISDVERMARKLYGVSPEFTPEEAANIPGIAFTERDPWLMWVEDGDKMPEVAHEAFHVTAGILRARGMKLSEESEEAYTYTLTALLEAFCEKKGWKSDRPRKTR